MSILDTFLTVCEDKDKEWLFRTCANRCLGHAMQVQKRKSPSRNFQEVPEDGSMYDSESYKKKDNLAEVEKWSKVLRTINVQDDEELVKAQVIYLTGLNENPIHSEKDIARWVEATQPMFDSVEKAREYSIQMLNQLSANSYSDWLEFGGSVEVEVISELRHGNCEEYPDDLVDAIAQRITGMITFIDRVPSLKSMGKRNELVAMQKQFA
jgi:hypothetical protein